MNVLPDSSSRSAAGHAASSPWRGIPLLVGLFALGIYAPLCPPVSGTGDASEFTLVLATGGVAHPTGYPIYTLFGHGFCVLLHTLGVGWPQAAATWSALGAAVAVALLMALAMEIAAWAGGTSQRIRVLAPLVPVALFACQPTVLEEATRAEINSWSVAWGCGATWVFARMTRSLATAPAAACRDARLGAVWWGTIGGLGLAHHLTSVLIFVPLTAALAAMLGRRRMLSPSLAGLAAAGALVPIATYAWIVWRAWHPVPGQWPLLEPTLSSVIDHVRGAGYGHFLGRFAPMAAQRERLATEIYPFLFPGLLSLVLGATRARDVDRRLGWWALFAAASLVSGFTFSYGVPDPAPYFLPAVAIGVAAAGAAIAAIPGTDSRGGMAAIAAVGMVSLLLIAPWIRHGVSERRETLVFEKVIRSMWSAIPPDSAIVSWTDDRFHHLVEYQLLGGEKPALFIITPDLLLAAPVRRRVRERFGADPLASFQPVRGVRAGTPEEAAAIDSARWRLLQGLSDRIRVPVILFDPKVPIVWQFRKPWEPQAAGPARSPAGPHGGHPSAGAGSP